MHAFNLCCKSLFALVWICSSPSPWWDVICCCLISSMAAFTFSNWLQATAINVVTRVGKPHVIPSDTSYAKHCKKGICNSRYTLKWRSWIIVVTLMLAYANDYGNIILFFNTIYVPNSASIMFRVSFIEWKIAIDWIDVTFWCN
jgi:hypothetical protein